MIPRPHSTLQAIADAAAAASSASHGWLLTHDGGALVPVAVTGPGAGLRLDEMVADGEGSAGYVLSSGQPLAVRLRGPDDGPWTGAHPLLGRAPDSILAVPCVAERGPVGVLELVNSDSGSFSYDDVELATLLGGIAGAALAEGTARRDQMASPEEIGRSLVSLWADDPERYGRLVTVIESLLDG